MSAPTASHDYVGDHPRAAALRPAAPRRPWR